MSANDPRNKQRSFSTTEVAGILTNSAYLDIFHNLSGGGFATFDRGLGEVSVAILNYLPEPLQQNGLKVQLCPTGRVRRWMPLKSLCTNRNYLGRIIISSHSQPNEP